MEKTKLYDKVVRIWAKWVLWTMLRKYRGHRMRELFCILNATLVVWLSTFVKTDRIVSPYQRLVYHMQTETGKKSSANNGSEKI